MAICAKDIFLRGAEEQRQRELDDIYETKRGAASLPANGVGRVAARCRRLEVIAHDGGLIFPPRTSALALWQSSI